MAERHRLAKVLTKGPNGGSVPSVVTMLLFGIPILVLLATKWMWHLFLISVPTYFILRAVYKKDEYGVAYFIKELFSPQHFEP